MPAAAEGVLAGVPKVNDDSVKEHAPAQKHQSAHDFVRPMSQIRARFQVNGLQLETLDTHRDSGRNNLACAWIGQHDRPGAKQLEAAQHSVVEDT